MSTHDEHITVRSRRRLSLLVAGLALLATGCAVGEGHDVHADASPADGARVIALTGDDFRFDPDRIEIGAGEAIAIELTAADLEHDFVVDGLDAHVHADPGTTSTGALSIDEPGRYAAYCSVPGHREAGMTATVVVTD